MPFIAQNKDISLRDDELEEHANALFTLKINHFVHARLQICFFFFLHVLLILPYEEFDLALIKHLRAFRCLVFLLRRLITAALPLLLLV